MIFPWKKSGVRIDACKKNTKDLLVVPMTLPDRVYIPMRQGQGIPATPCVMVGDSVKVGTLIGRPNGAVSAPVHSSVSGKVTAVERFGSLLGGEDIQIVIDCDGRQELDAGIRPPRIESIGEFMDAVYSSGLVGLGGAGFPMAAKLAAGMDVKIDTLIINAVECEPFVTSGYVTMISHPTDVIEGARALMYWLGIDRTVIAISESCGDAEDVFEEHLPKNEDISLFFLRDRYPAGSETFLVGEITGRELLAGRIPADVGCLVCNVSSVIKLWHYLSTGLPLVSRNITVDGSAVASPQNIEAPIGTRIRDILAFCGGASAEIAMALTGGVMMGRAVPSLDVPVTKTDNAVLFFDADFALRLREKACINCGRCIEVCTEGLSPRQLCDAAEAGDVEKMERYRIRSCNNCGACSYICPARRRLSNRISEAKFALEARHADLTGKEAKTDGR